MTWTQGVIHTALKSNYSKKLGLVLKQLFKLMQYLYNLSNINSLANIHMGIQIIEGDYPKLTRKMRSKHRKFMTLYSENILNPSSNFSKYQSLLLGHDMAFPI